MNLVRAFLDKLDPVTNLAGFSLAGYKLNSAVYMSSLETALTYEIWLRGLELRIMHAAFAGQ